MPRKIALASAALCAALTVCALSVVQHAQKGRQYTPPAYVFSPDVPKDMVTHDTGAIGFMRIRIKPRGRVRHSTIC